MSETAVGKRRDGETIAIPGDLVSEGTSRYVVWAKARADEGGQVLYRFPNGLGASVVRYLYHYAHGSYGTYGAEKGLFEVGVARFPDPASDDWELDQEHRLVADEGGVRGFLTARQVEDMLLELLHEPVSS